MKVVALRETFPQERRVALTPQVAAAMIKKGWEVGVESGAGDAAGFPDSQFQEKGVEIFGDRSAAIQAADVVLQVRTYGANPAEGRADLEQFRPGQTVVGMCDPLGNPQAIQELADRKTTLFAMELIPRITRAQSMDVLSSMATLAGYKAVLLGAGALPRILPMMMTAAGTVP
ncbi:MAG: NAD(P)(+) transhydrogenase (Re/Si-specific) subunit alpha, partial [Planctomycetales bacterium]|nr:NAD(P)(+) transhydrogenase (Re/Si-specific) subunit alpha [Planctomycetales bacterium]